MGIMLENQRERREWVGTQKFIIYKPLPVVPVDFQEIPVNLCPGLCYPRKVIRLQDVIFASLYAIIPAIDNQSSKLVDSWV